jgi:hypothetical protein
MNPQQVVTSRIPKVVYDRLLRLSHRRNVSVSALIRHRLETMVYVPKSQKLRDNRRTRTNAERAAARRRINLRRRRRLL